MQVTSKLDPFPLKQNTILAILLIDTYAKWLWMITCNICLTCKGQRLIQAVHCITPLVNGELAKRHFATNFFIKKMLLWKKLIIHHPAYEINILTNKTNSFVSRQRV